MPCCRVVCSNGSAIRKQSLKLDRRRPSSFQCVLCAAYLTAALANESKLTKNIFDVEKLCPTTAIRTFLERK